MDISAYQPKKTLAVFDFDGTITSGDTMIHFIIFARGKSALYFSYLGLSFTLILYKLGMVDNETAKKELLKWHFKGMTKTELLKLGQDFCGTILPKLIRPGAQQRLAWHQQMGHRVSIVSAALDFWLRPWCESNRYDCISTLPKFESGKFTGEFDSPNCYGPEKVKRIRNVVPADSFEFIYAYGDTEGDREMLDFANMWYYKPFR